MAIASDNHSGLNGHIEKMALLTGLKDRLSQLFNAETGALDWDAELAGGTGVIGVHTKDEAAVNNVIDTLTGKDIVPGKEALDLKKGMHFGGWDLRIPASAVDTQKLEAALQ